MLTRSEGVVVVREQQPWLDVPFAEKDEARAAGAQWDWRAKRWYAPRPGMAELARWLPVHQAEPEPDPVPDPVPAPVPDPVSAHDPVPDPEPSASPGAAVDGAVDGVVGGVVDGTARLAAALRGLTEPGAATRSTRRRPPWRVLHDVPVGPGPGEVDHVLVGPPGVVTVNAELHVGSTVEVDGDVLTVDGRALDRVPRARAEAERAARLLAAAHHGEAPPVTAALAVVAGSVGVARGGEAPRGVLVTTPRHLPWLLTGLPAVLADDEVDELYAVARRLGTWTREL